MVLTGTDGSHMQGGRWLKADDSVTGELPKMTTITNVLMGSHKFRVLS